MTFQPAPRDQGDVPREDDGQSDDVQLVVCSLGDERYGLEVGLVREIIRHPTITALPGSGRAVGGVINLRGRIIPVLDLRERFGMPTQAPTSLSRVVVTDAGGLQVGLVVDAVSEVVRILRSAIEPTPALASSAGSEHLSGIAHVGDELIILLDLERLLATDVATDTVTVDAAGDGPPGGPAPAADRPDRKR
jgi:purine-binding chemotaxis protein CheW